MSETSLEPNEPENDESTTRLELAKRRSVLFGLGAGLGSVALSWLLARDRAFANVGARSDDPLAPKPPDRPARAKACIFLLMEGGPSQVDTFDPKPLLARHAGKFFERKDALESAQTRGSDRFVVASPFRFDRYGVCGREVSELFRHTAEQVDDIAFIRSVHCDSDNHPAALFQLTTGNRLQGSPSMGAWAVYGLGSDVENLPAYVVLRHGRPFGGTATWGSGFLSPTFQGTQLRGGSKPILDLESPPGITPTRQRRSLDLIQNLNRSHEARLPHHPDLAARIASYELAFRMQAEVPEAVDIAREPESVRHRYGLDDDRTRDFGSRCLLARRLVERGVRFVQVWSGGWDSHDDVEGGHRHAASLVDRPIAGLLGDLKDRGLLDETLVVWGGEFGRTPDSRGQSKSKPGRDHNPGAMTMWFAGGGVEGGRCVGETDDLGNRAVEKPFHLRDIHATFLHLLGLDQDRLVYYHAGRFKRLTDTGGKIIHEIL
jgi:hypothetical protein